MTHLVIKMMMMMKSEHQLVQDVKSKLLLKYANLVFPFGGLAKRKW